MAPSKSTNPKDLLTGGVLQCVEAATIGLPFEVWKTHMGTYRNEGTVEAFKNIYNKKGVAGFWAGWQPKMVESFLKGGILLFSKEAIIRTATNQFGLGEVAAGLVGGFGGGVAQVTVMGPCTFLVTAAVTGDKSTSLLSKVTSTYKKYGVSGFYHGGTALILRQGSNWASRQGFTDIVRNFLKNRHLQEGETSNKHIRLSNGEEAVAGIIGGSLSTWNQPFEVIRIEAQANASKGLPPRSFVQTYQHIVKESGFLGLFQGILPRMGLCIGQTLFLVTVPHILKKYGF
mmetsp:Transcript_30618/g.33454  ORF Transcript_30618/g.33454 Transcript_30618/m.33454 type:complete len:287 (-) Transcript_30618:211-1071(-)|eukprot:CAMPEP_0173151272 /NCGR_PEP_ID=MMETSP1105-20130129/11473_1 /TAXON_ID=2985 /ORGANISM="Ochromonas sp., Strain BG-1" /LENGTH=286 /DNA_ID=CAMNT_0014066599 /DNA_START=44 /DNA_END=904 /DNA_ORIENTATION=-